MCGRYWHGSRSCGTQGGWQWGHHPVLDGYFFKSESGYTGDWRLSTRFPSLFISPSLSIDVYIYFPLSLSLSLSLSPSLSLSHNIYIHIYIYTFRGTRGVCGYNMLTVTKDTRTGALCITVGMLTTTCIFASLYPIILISILCLIQMIALGISNWCVRLTYHCTSPHTHFKG